MSLLWSELSIGELTSLLCAIVCALIPLTIRVLYDLERRKHRGWARLRQRPVRAKIN